MNVRLEGGIMTLKKVRGLLTIAALVVTQAVIAPEQV